MSGGVDSSVAAALMLEQGHDCAGFTLDLRSGLDDRLGRPRGAARDLSDARAVAERLGIAHYALDFSREFELRVVEPFARAYLRGETPNPCVFCNLGVKFNFGLLSRALLAHDFDDFDLLATGHYARVALDPASGRHLLRKARDPQKDQSYVLYGLRQQELSRARFPLGEFTKREAREIARAQNLATGDKAESQDICFVPEGDYGAFIEAYVGEKCAPGDIVDPAGAVLGRHRGIIRYTIGQRRGLGVSAAAPLYVAEKSPERNAVVLAPESGLYRKSLVARDANLIACARLDGPTRVQARTRYQQKEQAATVWQTAERELRVEFDSPQRAIAPGQAVVLYDGDLVIGGGTIAPDH